MDTIGRSRMKKERHSSLRHNRHQPEMSQRLILQCLFKAKGSVIYVHPCFALCRKKTLQKGHSPFWPPFVASDFNDKRKTITNLVHTYYKERVYTDPHDHDH